MLTSQNLIIVSAEILMKLSRILFFKI